MVRFFLFWCWQKEISLCHIKTATLFEKEKNTHKNVMAKILGISRNPAIFGYGGAVLDRGCFFVGKNCINIMHDVFAEEERKILDFLFLRSIMYFNKAQHNRMCVRK